MLELLLIIGAAITIGRVAAMHGESSFVWGALTVLFCLLSLILPIPFLRIFIVAIAMIVVLFVRGMKAGVRRQI